MYFTFGHQDFCLILCIALLLDWEHMAPFVRWATAIWVAYGSELTSKILHSAWTCFSKWEVDYRETQQQKIKQDIASWTAEWSWGLTGIALERKSTRFHKFAYLPNSPSPPLLLEWRKCEHQAMRESQWAALGGAWLSDSRHTKKDTPVQTQWATWNFLSLFFLKIIFDMSLYIFSSFT